MPTHAQSFGVLACLSLGPKAIRHTAQITLTKKANAAQKRLQE